MRLTRFLTTLGLAGALSACATPAPETYDRGQAAFDFKDFFTGPVRADGLVHDWRGRVTRRFEVDMTGTWTGDRGVLDEVFRFDDGEEWTRAWHVTRLNATDYTATAEDIDGTATGRQTRGAIAWDYVLEVPLKDGKRVKLRFDDRMWLATGDVLINRSEMSKFGMPVGAITLVMRKGEAAR